MLKNSCSLIYITMVHLSLFFNSFMSSFLIVFFLVCKYCVKALRMELTGIKDAFDRVSKKQKLSSCKTKEVIDNVVQEIEEALQSLQSAESNHKLTLAGLKEKLQNIAPVNQLESKQKELNAALSKYPKVLEKSFNPSISKAYRNIDFDSHTVNQIIASHFFGQGLFDIGDGFVTEAGEPESASSVKSTFQELFQMLEAMKSRNLEPALNWASTNSDKLKQKGSDLELKLHSLYYLEILQKGSRNEALQYIRKHLASFAENHFNVIQKLVTCLLWHDRLTNSPYADLLSPAHWEIVSQDLTRQFFNLLGQSSESPLSVTIKAGAQGLPPLLKFMTVMAGKKHDWQTMKQLPVPVELDSEFQFHSVFVCPVSKEQSSDDNNPPMIMSCGHVLCKQSISKMSKNSSKTFKCPYCPSDIDATQCRQLYF